MQIFARYESDDKLEPCPECKGVGKKYANFAGTLFYCKCDDCGFSTIRCTSSKQAITLWNDFSIVNNKWLESEE